MSMIDRLFGDSEKHPSKPLSDADSDMRKVLEALGDLNGQPIEMLTPQEARRQPTPTDAVMRILRERKLDGMADLGVTTEDITLDGAAGPLQARIYRPDSKHPKHPVVVYFHGGGWVIANLDVYDAGPRAVARFADCIVVSCEYRMAPENPFPAAHDDAVAAWKWVVANAASFGGDPSNVAVMGESAGGNLAANVAIAARDQGLQAPVHMALIYPIAGNDMNTESYLEYEHAKPLSKAMMAWFVEHVFTDKSQSADLRINLVAADLHGLPSATVIRAQIDPLCSDGELLAERLEAAGVDVRAKTFHGVTHEFFGMGLVVKDAAAAELFVAHDLKKAFGTAILPI